MDYVRPMKGSQIFHRWSFVTVLAALLERRVWLDRGRMGVLFPNMYTILVGPPAAGKSTAAQLSVDLFQKVLLPATPAPKLGPTKITQAALYKELKAAERMYNIPGAGDCRSSPLFIYASELAINMVDFGGGTLTNELIDFYDSKSLTAKMEKRIVSDVETLTLTNPSLTLLGCTTDTFLQSAAQEKLITSGLSSRILFVVEPNRVYKERKHIEPDAPTYQALIDALSGVYRLSGVMQFDRQAQIRYIELAEKADQDCFEGKLEFHQNYYGRKPDHISKVAMVLAAINGSKTVSTENLDQALSWIEDLEPYMIKAFGSRIVTKDEDLNNKILLFIPAEGISEVEMLAKMDGAGMFISKDTGYQGVIDGLIANGTIREAIIGGRKMFIRNATNKS